MKKLYSFIFIFFIILSSSQLKATHVMGGAITWEAIGKDTFKVILTAYRDCNGVYLDSAELLIRSKCFSKKVKTTLVSKDDITPVCNNECSRCVSQQCSFKYGLQKIVLVGVFTTTDFIKQGCCDLTLIWSTCCRVIPLFPSNQIFYLKSYMNACLSNGNNSPSFTEPPLSIICINQDQIISCSAVDNDSDSLRYSLTPALKDSSTPIAYQTPYTYTKPLYYKGFPRVGLTFPDGFHFDAKTGLVMFRPMKIEQSIFAYKVTEYKKGKMVSEITHDMLVVVIKCPSNAPPILSGVNCKNPKLKNFEIEICPGEKLEFRICTSDSDKGDTVKIKSYDEIPTATFTVTNSGSKREEGLFSWIPELSDARAEPYIFTVEAYDNACPMIGKTIRSFSIKVKELGPEVIVDSTLGNCGQLFVVAKTKDNAFSKSFVWQIGDQKISHKGGTSDTLIFKTKESGQVPFSVQTVGNNSCSNFYKDTFLVQEHLSIKTINDTTVCEGSILNLTSTSAGYSRCCKQKITWSTGDTASGTNSSIFLKVGNTDTSAWVTSTDGKCSDSDFVQIYIRHAPKVLLPDSQFYCLGNSSVIKPKFILDTNITGYNIAFEWRKMGDTTIISTDTFLTIDSVGVYKLRAIDDLGCALTKSIILTENKSWTPKDTFTCGSNPISIELPNISGITYKWKDQADDTATSFIGATRTISIAKRQFFRILSIEKSGRSECQTFDSFMIDVENIPNVKTTPSAAYACPNNRIAFKADPAGGTWTGPGVAANSTDLILTADSTYLGHNKYIYSYTNAKGCSNADTSILWIYRAPKARIEKPDSLVKQGSSIYIKSKSYSTANTVATWISTNPDSIKLEGDSILVKFESMGQSSIVLILYDTLTHCSDSAQINLEVIEPVTRNEWSNERRVLYPNPSSGIVSIQGMATNAIIQVYGTNGQLLFQGEITHENNQIDLAYLENGIYFYRITNYSGSYAGKLMIER